jgi:hypothetical protein
VNAVHHRYHQHTSGNHDLLPLIQKQTTKS